MKCYIATVQICVACDGADWASIFIHETLDDCLDWSYLKVGGQYLLPTEHNLPNVDSIAEYEAGDFLAQECGRAKDLIYLMSRTY